MSSRKWTRPRMFQDEPANIKLQSAYKITDLKNLGPVAETHFAAIGIKTAKQFQKLGWKKTMQKLVAHNPKHRHSLYAYALIGALQNKDWNRIAEADKADARAFCLLLKTTANKKKTKN